MKESDIFYENGYYWVWHDRDGFHCMVTGNVCSIGDSSYADASCAIARVDYLAKTHTDGKNIIRFNAIKKSLDNEKIIGNT